MSFIYSDHQTAPLFTIKFCYTAMKKALLILTGLFISFFAVAQGEMNNLALEPNPFLCKPGVTNKSPGKGLMVDYNYNPEFRMRPTNAEQPSEVEANQRFTSKIKIPVIHGSRVKFLLGFKYAFERYNFENINPENYSLFQRMNEATLKDVESAAYLIVPINHKYYTSFRVSASFRGDYDGFLNTHNDYATYRAAGIFGIKKRDDLEYGFGLYFSKNIRRTIAYPFGFLNWTFNDKWGLEAAIPVSIKLRRNLNDRNLLLFGTDFSSQNYTLHVNEISTVGPTTPLTYLYRRQSLEMSASWMKKFSGWTWMQYKIGYSFNINSDAFDLTDNLEYDLRPTGCIVGSVTFFLSPPKKLMK